MFNDFVPKLKKIRITPRSSKPFEALDIGLDRLDA
jgi:hypothetical protein